MRSACIHLTASVCASKLHLRIDISEHVLINYSSMKLKFCRCQETIGIKFHSRLVVFLFRCFDGIIVCEFMLDFCWYFIISSRLYIEMPFTIIGIMFLNYCTVASFTHVVSIRRCIRWCGCPGHDSLSSCLKGRC